jgi:hypothetical protein
MKAQFLTDLIMNDKIEKKFNYTRNTKNNPSKPEINPLSTISRI